MEEKSESKEKSSEEEQEAQVAIPFYEQTFVLVGAASFIVLLIIVFCVVFLSTEPKRVEQQVVEIEDPDDVLSGAMLTLPRFTLNLRSSNSYIYLKLGLEFHELELPDRIDESIIAIKDAVIQLVNDKTDEELITQEGRDKLKQELILELNKFLEEDRRIANIYYLEFAVQEE